ncbi:MAG TPA: DUF983 domain-containing protein [Parvibaculum sp.]
MSSILDMGETHIFEATKPESRNFWQAIGRGFMMRCPNCGKGKLFRAFLKVADTCPNCGEELHHHQADDAPPYFTILIVGHIVVPLMLAVELEYMPPVVLQMVFWPTLTLALALILLPRIKGAVVGMQWAQRMHGFGGSVE